MIKRIRFVTRRRGLPAKEFPAAWVGAVALGGSAPVGVRPARTTACIRQDATGTEAPYDGITMEWFADMDAVRRFEAWLGTEEGLRAASAAEAVESNAATVVVAEERVMRGSSWLERRWADRGMKLKHMALARRAHGMTPAEFSERWRSRAGTIGGAGSARVTAIPDEAKGHAYVQNHPVPTAALDWVYDAINEVYFDDLGAMQSRIDFFRRNDVARADADLVSEATFIAVTEEIIDFGQH